VRYVCVVLRASQNNDWFKLLFQICCQSAENGKKTQNALQSGLGHSVSLCQDLSWPCACLQGGDLQLLLGSPKSCSGVAFMGFQKPWSLYQHGWPPHTEVSILSPELMCSELCG